VLDGSKRAGMTRRRRTKPPTWNIEISGTEKKNEGGPGEVVTQSRRGLVFQVKAGCALGVPQNKKKGKSPNSSGVSRA